MPQNLEQAPQFADCWMPAWLSWQGPNERRSRAKTRSSAACVREPQCSSSDCEQHLSPTDGPGKKRNMQPRQQRKALFTERQQTEVQFAHRHLSPTPQFSPSLRMPVWEATAQPPMKSALHPSTSPFRTSSCLTRPQLQATLSSHSSAQEPRRK